MAGDQVLSQADIDALLSGKPPAPAPAGPPPPAAPAPAAAPPAAASDALRGMVDQLGARLRGLEDAVGRLGQQQPGPAGGASDQLVRQLQQQLQTLSATVDSIVAALPNTVGFRAHDNFVCSECQTKGFVAARLNCTACGKENWWGWWPPPKQ